jgi:hypothetical protein
MINTNTMAGKNERKFYFLVIFIAFFILIKTNFTHQHKTIEVTLLKQNGNINSFSSAKDIKEKIQFNIEEINFPENDQLYYENTGNLGYKQDFFLILKTTMDVKKIGSYQFSVKSDDGFQLKINNKTICEYNTIRGMEETRCKLITLNPGQYNLQLDYFQGYGRLGLIAEYVLYDKRITNANHEKKSIGQNSEFIHFLPLTY